MKRANPFRNLSFFFLVMILAYTVMSYTGSMTQSSLSRQEFETLLSDGGVTEITVRQNRETPTGEAVLLVKGDDGKQNAEHFFVSDVNRLQEELTDRGLDYKTENIPENSDWMNYLLPTLIAVAGAVAVIWIMQGRAGGGSNSKMMNFGKSRARMTRDNKENFSSVAGLAEEKEDLEQIVDFLKDPKKYHSGGPARNRKDTAREGSGRRSRRSVLFHFRFRLCGNVRRRGRVQSARPV